MPELPDLVYIEERLNHLLPGKTIVQVDIREPIVLRVLTTGGFEASLLGVQFDQVCRHGPFLRFQLDAGLELVLHPMLAGRLKHATPEEKTGRGLCVTFVLQDGSCLHYLDDKKMGKVYLIPAGQYGKIPRYLEQGVNILSPDFTLERLQKLIKGQRKQVRVFLMDQTLLSAIGNAYADEILFDAGVHPKTFCHQLDAGEVERLYSSIATVMQWGIAEVKKAGQPIEVKVRDHVKVRNRKGQPCPRCTTTIRREGVLGVDTFFCPTCQPAKRTLFIEWS